MAGIFIGYRREDSAGYAGRLADTLAARFGDDHVFRDLEDIRPGDDFATTIDEAVGACDALLIVIGPRWLDVKDEAGTSRLGNPRDFVRIEIVAALRRGIRVIPILVGGARMPKVEELPADIADLAGRQAHELSDSRWSYDVERLIELLVSAGVAEPETGSAASAARRTRGRKAVASPRVWGLGVAATAVAFFGVLNLARWAESRTDTGSGSVEQVPPAGLPDPNAPLGGPVEPVTPPAAPPADTQGLGPAPTRPGMALRPNRILLSVHGAAVPDRATTKAALTASLVAADYEVLDAEGSVGGGDPAHARALVAMARGRGAGAIVVGFLDAHAEPSVGRFFTGTASLALTVYSASDGRIVGSETVAIGSRGVPGRLATSAEAARSDAATAIGALAARSVLRQIPAREARR